MAINTATSPSTEGKAPENNTSGTTLASTTATSTTSTTATDTTKATATAQIISGTTPATTTQTTTTASATPASPAQNTAATPFVDYLKGGYFRGEGKKRYTDPALVGQAEAIGKALAESGTPATAIKKMVRTLKSAARLPHEAQQGSLEKLTPQVLDLEHKKKAPALLREVVKRNQAAVQNEDDFKACVDHFQDIAIYLQAAQD